MELGESFSKVRYERDGKIESKSTRVSFSYGLNGGSLRLMDIQLKINYYLK